MDDIKLALLGSKEAAKRLTDAGVLVPCPFCGGEANLENHREYGWKQYDVICSKCFATFEKTFYKEKEARKSWNTRAPILSESELKKLEKTT